MPAGLELQRCCCSNRGQRKGKKGKAGVSLLGGIKTACQELPSGFFRWGSSVCPPMGQQFTMLLAAPEKADWAGAILLRWPQSPGSSQSIPLSRPLSFCQLLSAPQSASQRTSSGKIEVAIQALTFSHSLFFPPNSFLTQWAGVRDTTWCIPAWLVAQQAIEQEISLSFRRGWGELNSGPEWREEEDLSPSVDNAAFSGTLISPGQWAWFSSYHQLHHHRHPRPPVLFQR